MDKYFFVPETVRGNHMWSRCLLACHAPKFAELLLEVLSTSCLLYGDSKGCWLVPKTAVYFEMLDGSPGEFTWFILRTWNVAGVCTERNLYCILMLW